MKRIFLIIVLIVMCLSVYGEDLSIERLIEGIWDLYFISAVWENEHYYPHAHKENVLILFGDTVFLITTPDGSDKKSYRYSLFAKTHQLNVYDLQGNLLWVWFYIHPNRDILVCTGWCPKCELQDEDILAILVKQ